MSTEPLRRESTAAPVVEPTRRSVAGVRSAAPKYELKGQEREERRFAKRILMPAFVVSLAVIILRVREPDLERGFKVPFYPVLPVLSIIGCFWIISSLQVITIVVFIIWTAFR